MAISNERKTAATQGMRQIFPGGNALPGMRQTQEQQQQTGIAPDQRVVKTDPTLIEPSHPLGENMNRRADVRDVVWSKGVPTYH